MTSTLGTFKVSIGFLEVSCVGIGCKELRESRGGGGWWAMLGSLQRCGESGLGCAAWENSRVPSHQPPAPPFSPFLLFASFFFGHPGSGPLPFPRFSPSPGWAAGTSLFPPPLLSLWNPLNSAGGL
eukprot:RCo052651